MNEDAPVNSAGDGSRVALPPAHVIVGKRSRTKYRKNSDRKEETRELTCIYKLLKRFFETRR